MCARAAGGPVSGSSSKLISRSGSAWGVVSCVLEFAAPRRVGWQRDVRVREFVHHGEGPQPRCHGNCLPFAHCEESNMPANMSITGCAG